MIKIRNRSAQLQVKHHKVSYSSASESTTTQDQSKRKVRTGHFQSDFDDDYDMALNTQRIRVTQTENYTDPSVAVSFEVGYW
jgi:hypothetical protein